MKGSVSEIVTFVRQIGAAPAQRHGPLLRKYVGSPCRDPHFHMGLIGPRGKILLVHLGRGRG